MDRDTDGLTPTIEEERVEHWKAALIMSLSPTTRKILRWLHNPHATEEEVWLTCVRFGRTILERAAVRVYLEELTWQTAWCVAEIGGES